MPCGASVSDSDVTEAPAAARDVDAAAPLVTAEAPQVPVGPRQLGLVTHRAQRTCSKRRLWSGYHPEGHLLCHQLALALVRGIKEVESQRLAKQLLYSGMAKVLGFTCHRDCEGCLPNSAAGDLASSQRHGRDGTRASPGRCSGF